MLIETDEEFSKRKSKAQSDLKKCCQKAHRRVQGIKEKLKECSHWYEVYHEGELLQSNLFKIQPRAKEVVVADWEKDGKERKIVLDPLKPASEQLKLLFKRSKKLKAGIPHTEKQLKIAEKDLALWMDREEALGHVKTLDELLDFCAKNGLGVQPQPKPLVAAKPLPAKPYHVFKSEAGVEIWVGKSAKDNDKLTFHYANKLDWWLHASGCSGSHVVIRLPQDTELDHGTLHDAAELALRHSKAKGQDSGDVSLTQVKGIVSVRGSPGKVMISKHKNIYVRLDDKRWERLKASR